MKVLAPARRRSPQGSSPTSTVSADLGVATAPKKASDPIHMMIDSTGLKLFEDGEWRHEKYDGKPRRSWRKLSLAVDPDSGKILASALTTMEEGDAPMADPLRDQIESPPASLTADGAYGGEANLLDLLPMRPTLR